MKTLDDIMKDLDLCCDYCPYRGNKCPTDPEKVVFCVKHEYAKQIAEKLQAKQPAKNYFYFVSCIYSDGNKIRFSNAEIKLSNEITSMADLIRIGELLKEDEKLNRAPTIMNYKLMRVEEEGGSDE